MAESGLRQGNEKVAQNKKLMQSYVWHQEKCFFVSTIDRESSAVMAYGGTYAETMVWEYDYEKRECGDLVGQTEGAAGSIQAHLRMCDRLHRTGRCEEDESA